MTPVDRPRPEVASDTEFFWRSGADGRLRILRCDDCTRYIHPPLPRCPFCGSRAVVPRVVSGDGRIHSFTINHHLWRDDMPDPYVIALVELAEQPDVRLVTNIVGCEPRDVRVDQRVRVTFEQQEDVFYPLFAPIAA